MQITPGAPLQQEPAQPLHPRELHLPLGQQLHAAPGQEHTPQLTIPDRKSSPAGISQTPGGLPNDPVALKTSPGGPGAGKSSSFRTVGMRVHSIQEDSLAAPPLLDKQQYSQYAPPHAGGGLGAPGPPARSDVLREPEQMRAFLRTKQEEELTPESFGNFYDSAQQPADPGIVHSPPQRAGGIFLPQPSMDQQTHAEYYHRYYQQAQAPPHQSQDLQAAAAMFPGQGGPHGVTGAMIPTPAPYRQQEWEVAQPQGLAPGQSQAQPWSPRQQPKPLPQEYHQHAIPPPVGVTQDPAAFQGIQPQHAQQQPFRASQAQQPQPPAPLAPQQRQSSDQQYSQIQHQQQTLAPHQAFQHGTRAEEWKVDPQKFQAKPVLIQVKPTAPNSNPAFLPPSPVPDLPPPPQADNMAANAKHAQQLLHQMEEMSLAPAAAAANNPTPPPPPPPPRPPPDTSGSQEGYTGTQPGFKGVCAVCNQAVTVQQTRTKNAQGQYVHGTCAPVAGLAPPPPKTSNAVGI